MINLNENEKAVYDACVAGIYGDTGCEFDIPWGTNNLSDNQIKGYLASLEKKGLIEMDTSKEYYCDGWVVANPDGTPFITEEEYWTGAWAYGNNKARGLYGQEVEAPIEKEELEQKEEVAEKITYKQVTCLQNFDANDLVAAKRIHEALVDEDKNVLVSYQVNIDNPRDVTFIVGATDPSTLKAFIKKHSYTLAELSVNAEIFIRKYYSDFRCFLDL